MGKTILSSRDRLWLGFACCALALLCEGWGFDGGNSFVLLLNGIMGVAELGLLYINIHGATYEEKGKVKIGLKLANYSDVGLLVLVSITITSILQYWVHNSVKMVQWWEVTRAAGGAALFDFIGSRLCRGCEPNLESARLKMYVGMIMNGCAVVSAVMITISNSLDLEIWVTVFSGMVIAGLIFVSIQNRRPEVEPVDIENPDHPLGI